MEQQFGDGSQEMMAIDQQADDYPINPDYPGILDETTGNYFDKDGNPVDPPKVIASWTDEKGMYIERLENGSEYHYPPGENADDGTTTVGAEQHNDNPIDTRFREEEQNAARNTNSRNATPKADQNNNGRPPLVPALNLNGADNNNGNNDDDPDGEARVPVDGGVGTEAAAAATDGLHVVAASRGCVENFVVEFFHSMGFKLYFSALLYNAFIIVMFLGFNYLFASMYRTFRPPNQGSDKFWQSTAHLSIFIVSSFFFVTFLGMIVDIWRDFWRLKQSDNMLWGVSFSHSHGPWPMYGLVILATTALPITWSAILTITTSRGTLHFIQYFFYIDTVIVMWMLLIAYGWFYVLSVNRKKTAYANRLNDPLTPRKKDYDRAAETGSPPERGETDADSDGSGYDTGRRSRNHTDDDRGGDSDDEGERRRRRRRQKKRDERKARRNEQAATTGGHAITVTYNKQGVPITTHRKRKHWYDSTNTLFEWGLDRTTLLWSLVVILFGLVPNFVVGIIVASSGVEVTIAIGWLIVGIAAFILLVFIREMTKKPARSIGIVLIVIAFVLYGVIGCAVSGSPSLIAVFFVQVIAIQGMFLRKREYRVRHHLIQSVIGEGGDNLLREDPRPPVDSYLCCCKKTCFSVFRVCLDVDQIFGVDHPLVRVEEKRVNHERISLNTDHKYLLVYWILMWVVLAGVVGHGRAFDPVYPEGQYATGNEGIPKFPASFAQEHSKVMKDYRYSPLCNIEFSRSPDNASKPLNVSEPMWTPVPRPTAAGPDATVPPFIIPHYGGMRLKMYDLALLTMLSYQFHHLINNDWSLWFSHNKDMLLFSDNIGSYIADDDKLYYMDFYDNKTRIHTVVLRSRTRGPSLYRSLDDWGDALVFQLSALFAPTLNFWPTRQKQNWVKGTNWLKRAYGQPDLLDPITFYVKNLTKHHEDVVVVGHGFNGGYAEIIGARAHVPSVSFNPPGNRLSAKKNGLTSSVEGARANRLQSYRISTDRSVYRFIDEPDEGSTDMYVPCDVNAQLEECSGMIRIIKEIGDMCGDEWGRGVKHLGGTTGDITG